MIHSWMRCSFRMLFLVSALLLPLLGAGWRNDGTGRFPQANPPRQWSKESNISWKVDLPGKSLASPVVVGKQVFVTSDPAELICLSATDGQIMWRKSHEYADAFGAEKGQEIEANLLLALEARKQKEELNRARDEAKKAGDNPKQDQLRAEMELLEKRYTALTIYPPKPGGDTGISTSTPVSDGQNIFAVFATGVVSSHSLAGKRNWMTFISDAARRSFGFAIIGGWPVDRTSEGPCSLESR